MFFSAYSLIMFLNFSKSFVFSDSPAAKLCPPRYLSHSINALCKSNPSMLLPDPFAMSLSKHTNMLGL